MKNRYSYRIVIIFITGMLFFIYASPFFAHSTEKKKTTGILKPENFSHYVDYFNRIEDENIVQAIPNSEAWKWMKSNIPLFECPQDNFEEMFYYRWWTLRKHIKMTPVGYAFTEFLVPRSYADKYNLISCALGHHIMEARWLHNPVYLDQYIRAWFRGNEGKPMAKLHRFSSWAPYAVYQKFLVDGNTSFLIDLLPDLKTEYLFWEKENRLPNGLYWQYDVRDGMEEQISGGRNVKNARPTINSYMYGNAFAISKIAELANDPAAKKSFQAKADTMKILIEQKLWNPEDQFFETLFENGSFSRVREEIGFIPWYFNLPGKKAERAWEHIKSDQGFQAPYGLTTAERRHPGFRTHGCCNCEWDGAVWPFATSQTLTGLANWMNRGDESIINDSVYFRQLELYVESQYKRGRPYVGEYLDETTGYWLKGDQERSRYYNHSTFNDLIITGLIGLRPGEGSQLEVNPLIPEGKWNWFCLDNVLYHGRIITVLWDHDGSKYKRGKGLTILVDGKVVARSEHLQKLTCKMHEELPPNWK